MLIPQLQDIENDLRKQFISIPNTAVAIIVLGLGGRTSSVAAPLVMKLIKKKKKRLTVFATFPARFEGPIRKKEQISRRKV